MHPVRFFTLCVVYLLSYSVITYVALVYYFMHIARILGTLIVNVQELTQKYNVIL